MCRKSKNKPCTFTEQRKVTEQKPQKSEFLFGSGVWEHSGVSVDAVVFEVRYLSTVCKH